MELTQQNIVKTFAKVYVNNEKELVSLLRKYGFNKQKFNETDVLLFISSLEGNDQFDKELSSLFSSSKYKNAVAEIISGAVTAIATMTGQVVGQKGRRESGELTTQSETQKALLEYIAKEKEIKASKEKTNIIIFGAVGIGIAVTIAILILKSK